MNHSVEVIEGFIGAALVGRPVVPLDLSWPADRLRFVLEDAGAGVILTHSGARLPLTPLPLLFLDRLRTAPELVAPEPVSALQLAYVLYTSGSTGHPKGVMIERRAIDAYLSWASRLYPAGVGLRTPVLSPLAFDLTLTSLFVPLVEGGEVTFPIPAPNPVDILAVLSREGGGFGLVKLTPSHLMLLNTAANRSDIGRNVRAFVVGGEQLPAVLAEEWQRDFPALQIFNEYGPTEATVGCVVYEANGRRTREGAVPIGWPMPGTSVELWDDDGNVVSGVGEGELVIEGAQVGAGYWGRPDLTEPVFTTDATTNVRSYRTGDRVRREQDGCLAYLGRTDAQVKIRGHRIELGEVEHVVREVSGAADVAVVARQSPAGDQGLHAFIVGGRAAGDERFFKSMVEGRLPAVMVPTRFSWVEDLPLTPNGKLDRQALIDTEDSTTARRILGIHPDKPSCPASFGQERLWLLDRFEGAGAAYNVPLVIFLSRGADPVRLQDALTRLIARHEALRTTFAATESGVRQVLHQEMSLPLTVVDLETTVEADRRWRVLATAEARRPFDLERGPLVRATLYKLPARTAVLLITMHHIVTDGWSEGVMLRDLASMYKGKAQELPEPLQFADFADWERERGLGNQQWLDEHLDYWRSALSSSVPTRLTQGSELPNGRTGRLLTRTLDAAAVHRLRDLVWREKTTLFLAGVSAFAATVRAFTQDADVVIGTTLAGRDRYEVRDTVGFFVQTVLLRLGVEVDASGRTLLGHVRKACQQAFAHADCPFQEVVRTLPSPSARRRPIHLMFSVEPTVPDIGELGWTVRRFEIDPGTTKFDLTVFLVEQDDCVTLVAEYDTNLLSETSVEAFLRAQIQSLECLATDPDETLRQWKLEGEKTIRHDADLEAWVRAHPDVQDVAVTSDEASGTTTVAIVPRGDLVTLRSLHSMGSDRDRSATRLEFVATIDRSGNSDAPFPNNRGHEKPIPLRPGPPETDTERRLATLWLAILEIDQPIRRQDNFFALGGHSLLAARLSFKVTEEFGVNVPLEDLYRAPDLATQAGHIDQASRQGSRRDQITRRARQATSS